MATEFAEPLPVRVISDSSVSRVQTSPASRSGAMSCSSEIRMEQRLSKHSKPATRSVAILSAMAETRRTEPGDDLMTHIARSAIDGVPLTNNEILGMTLLIYAAGNETTSMLIGNAIWLLDQHPEERERLRADPAAIPAALEEMLRFEAPVSHPGENDDVRCRDSGRHDSEGQEGVAHVRLGKS